LLKSEFEMKDIGVATKILGINILRDRGKGKLMLHQEDYINKIIEKFSMKDSKVVSQPITNQYLMSKSMCPKTKLEQEEMANVPYSNAVGSIMYLMVSTRPDLAYAISVLSRFMSSPGKEHWKAMKWLMRYLKGTSKLGLVYQGHQTH
jgi:hypothetical protein